jgi:ubiquinone/menaquinone biosynthesis C-methylase UbiE
MTVLRSIKKYLRPEKLLKKESPEAYDLWSSSYDDQPDNLMLHLDAAIFGELIGTIPLKGKRVIDVGCGTGRHWHTLRAGHPSHLTGYDVSPGMLNELKKKFPDADVHLVQGPGLPELADGSVDVIISTLTIAHLDHIGEMFSAWARVLKQNGDIVLTDFHPALLSQGGKRDFRARGQHVQIRNFVHPLDTVRLVAEKNKLYPLALTERHIDESVRHFYEKQQALPVYLKFLGKPVIYGIHLKKNDP